MRAVIVTLLLDVDTDAEAADATNEILREHQRSFSPDSALIDYSVTGSVDAGPLPDDYAEGDYFHSAGTSPEERALREAWVPYSMIASFDNWCRLTAEDPNQPLFNCARLFLNLPPAPASAEDDDTVYEGEARGAPAAPNGARFADMKPLRQIEEERAALDTPEAIAGRLSSAQRAVIERLAAEPRRYFTAKDLGISGATLNSLCDFERGKRDILAPLILITYERSEPSGGRIWSIASLGEEVAKHLPAESVPA